jgi:thiol-disulfide isomerase/thioredoxin
MSRRWQLLIAASVVITFVASLSWFPSEPLEASLLQALAQTEAMVEVEDAPPIEAADSQGRTVSLSQFQGDVVYVNFWAEYCEPCRDELPALNAFAERYRGRVVVLAVSIDEQPADGRAYLDQAFPDGVSFVDVYDPTARSSLAYGTTGVPETFIIDGSGLKLARFIGPQEFVSEPYLALAERLLRR